MAGKSTPYINTSTIQSELPILKRLLLSPIYEHLLKKSIQSDGVDTKISFTMKVPFASKFPTSSIELGELEEFTQNYIQNILNLHGLSSYFPASYLQKITIEYYRPKIFTQDVQNLSSVQDTIISFFKKVLYKKDNQVQLPTMQLYESTESYLLIKLQAL